MFEDQPFLLPAIIAGGAFLLLLVMVIVFKRYYHPCEMDEAIVRTGAGGPKVSVQGAMFVIPTFHNVQRVTLRSMKLRSMTLRFVHLMYGSILVLNKWHSIDAGPNSKR